MNSKIPLVDVSPGKANVENDIATPPKKEEKQNLYASHMKIQPKMVEGFYQNLRVLTVGVVMGGYLVLPWINWDGEQAILFDLPNRKFHFFEVTFWPQDFILLSWALIIAAFGLFIITTLFGRVYCGYTCPQTTWTRFFIWAEEMTEGPRHKRLKLDKAPWNLEKILRRGSKHMIWLLIAFATGYTFVGYFVPVRGLTSALLHNELGFWPIFWIGFFTTTTYLNAGWLREQVCKYMCPYARFQSVMFDKDTLIVSYDEKRGEKRHKGAHHDRTKYGDCIDCGLCVQVCPTGIDIRDGLQYECIACGACVDACNEVMEKSNLPTGLIRYTTENALEKGETDILRPRVIGYAVMMFLFSSAFIIVLFGRVPLELDIIRERGQLYRVTSDGQVENLYQLKMFNMSQDQQTLELTVSPAFLDMEVPETIIVPAGGSRDLPVRLSAEPEELEDFDGRIRFRLKSFNNWKLDVEEESRFLKPSS